MSCWNVRILHAYYPESGEHQLFAAEVFYEDDEMKVPRAWGNFYASGENVDEVRFYAKCLAEACEKPILESGDEWPKIYTPTT